jgi:hypothetical protein
LTVMRHVCFPDGEDTRRLLDNAKRIQKVTGKSFSYLTRTALEQYVEKQTKLIQTRLDTFKLPLEQELEKLHSEYVSPNPGGYGTFLECLKAKGLATEEAIEISVSKRWIKK